MQSSFVASFSQVSLHDKHLFSKVSQWLKGSLHGHEDDMEDDMTVDALKDITEKVSKDVIVVSEPLSAY